MELSYCLLNGNNEIIFERVICYELKNNDVMPKWKGLTKLSVRTVKKKSGMRNAMIERAFIIPVYVSGVSPYVGDMTSIFSDAWVKKKKKDLLMIRSYGDFCVPHTEYAVDLRAVKRNPAGRGFLSIVISFIQLNLDFDNAQAFLVRCRTNICVPAVPISHVFLLQD